MPEEIKDIIRWQRIGMICVELAYRLDISVTRAMDIFYHSKTAENFRNEATGLYLYGELYIVDELILELRHEL